MGSKFHALMYPWLGTGHITPFLHLANKLAEKGHTVTFLLPKKALKEVEHLNMFPENVFFRSVTVPHVNGLPVGVESMSEVSMTLVDLLGSAMDLTRGQVEDVVRDVKPDVIFFDFAYWMPEIGRELGIKTVNYGIVSACSIACTFVVPGVVESGVPPPGYPSSKVTLHKKDAHCFLPIVPSGPSVFERANTGLRNCDAIALRTVREIEGKFCDYVEKHSTKKVLLTGPMFPDPDKTTEQLEEQWSSWLGGFEPKSVVFCALGSQITLEKDQFQQLCLGMELTGLPFLVAVKPPKGTSTIQEALPDGFEERVKGRGVVWGGWVLLE